MRKSRMYLFFAVMTVTTLSLCANTPVEEHGIIRAKGNLIVDRNGEPVQLKGMSLFWSQWQGKYYTPEVVRWLVSDWNINVIRAAMAVDNGGYASQKKEQEKVETIIKAAIDQGIYVIVDFHVHDGARYQKEAVAFFSDIASRYGQYPNVIYEPWNEPVNHSWMQVIKPYHEAVIEAIRKVDPDNLIVCGTRTWSQQVEEASLDPLKDSNVAYTLHYYAATHKQALREQAARALKNGVALMVTEYGTCESTGNGRIDEVESREWWKFLDDNHISHCNWSVSDKKETASILKAGASPKGNWKIDDLTESGKIVRKEIRFRKYKATGLKDYYSNFFNIGVAVSPRSLSGDESDLIVKNFNSLTAENVMKSQIIHPEEQRYNWAYADSIVSFAQRHGMKMRGHTLVWHNQTPEWLFVSKDGKTVSKEVLLERMRAHIHNVVGRYRGKVYAWDVVNEAVSDRADEFLRDSKFMEICGEEYIRKAFEFAHEADPDALLFYNDYNEVDPVKREKIIKLVTSLKRDGVPVHGVGLQAHWAINEPTEVQLEKTLKEFSETGLILHVTEMDISVYPKEHNAREKRADDEDTAFSKEKQHKQEEVYDMCFRLFRKYKQYIKSVTFWNVSDRHSWLDNFPVKGRKDYPLLFDQSLQPKSAYYKITGFEQ